MKNTMIVAAMVITLAAAAQAATISKVVDLGVLDTIGDDEFGTYSTTTGVLAGPITGPLSITFLFTTPELLPPYRSHWASLAVETDYDGPRWVKGKGRTNQAMVSFLGPSGVVLSENLIDASGGTGLLIYQNRSGGGPFGDAPKPWRIGPVEGVRFELRLVDLPGYSLGNATFEMAINSRVPGNALPEPFSVVSMAAGLVGLGLLAGRAR